MILDAQRFAPRTVLIFCDGGFANRVNSLLGGLVLAEQMGWSYKVLWPRNNRCGAAFADVFNMPVAVHELRLQDLVPFEAELQLWLHENDVGFTQPVTPLRHLADASALQALRGDDERPVLFCENSLLPWLDAAAVKRALQSLNFNASLTAQARQLLQAQGAAGFIGIHLRCTDFYAPAPTEAMFGAVQANPDKRFFVCSDDAGVQARFAALPNVFVQAKTAYVEKRVDGPWRGDMRDSDGLPYSGNIERGADSVKQAVVDLLLLAASTPVLTSESSFLALAIRLRQSGVLAKQLAAPAPFTSQQEIIELLALLRPYALASDHKVRIGGDADGGYVMPSSARQSNAVVSIGIGDQVSFDAELADLGATVLQFDHTIPGAPLVHERLRFHRQGWGALDEGPLLSLHTMMQGIDWPQARHPILKFDTEGAEWDALAATESSDLARFEVIAGEFHGFHNLNHRSVYERIRTVLEKIRCTHWPVHLHANNATGIRLVQGVPVPPLMEVTFMRRDAAEFAGFCHEPIPGPLDRPNMADRPDICLRPF
jgi:hypothetical protein